MRAASRPRSKGCICRRSPPESAAYTTAVVRDIAQRYDDRRRPLRLHPLPDERVRLQPRHAGGVPRVGRARSRRRRSAPLRRADRRRRAARLHAGVSGAVARTSAPRGLTALLTSLRAACKAVQAVGAGQRRGRSRPARGRRASPAGLARLARHRAGRRHLPDGVHHRCRGLRRADRGGARRLPARIRCGPASARTGCPSDQIVENAQAARRLGVGGIILFSYDSLADPVARSGIRLAGRPRRVQLRAQFSSSSGGHGPDLGRLRGARRLPAGDHGVRLRISRASRKPPATISSTGSRSVVGICFTIVATETSTLTFIGVPGDRATPAT